MLLSVIASCKKSDISKESFAKDPRQAKTWLIGPWKLNKVNLQNTSTSKNTPHVKMAIKADGKLTLIQNDKITDIVSYEVIMNGQQLLLKTDAQPRSDNWYIRNPTLQITANAMYLDNGTSQDLGSYEFTRITEIDENLK